jgi:outer membrane PBP1 activator LpoA protein
MTKFKFMPVLAAAAISLSACGGQGDDKLGDDAAEAGEARADNLEAQAENASGETADALEQQADAAEDRGEKREEAIDDSDVDTSELSPEQRNALVNGQ